MDARTGCLYVLSTVAAVVLASCSSDSASQRRFWLHKSMKDAISGKERQGCVGETEERGRAAVMVSGTSVVVNGL